MGATSSRDNQIQLLFNQIPEQYKAKCNQLITNLDQNNHTEKAQFLFDKFPTPIKIALCKVWNQKINSDNDPAALKVTLLQFVLNILNDNATQLFTSTLSFSDQTLYELVNCISVYYLEQWSGKDINNNEEKESFVNYLLTYHWDKDLYYGEKDEDEVKIWLKKAKTKDQISQSELEQWFTNNSSFKMIWNQTFKQCLLDIPINQSYQSPKFRKGELSPILSWIIYLQVPDDCRKEWERVFHTETDGASWNAFQRKLTKNGSTLIIIKEKSRGKAHQFGAFSYMSWSPHPKFFGDGKAFLFSLIPTLRTYAPTNYNQNYQYFNQNAQTLPNGLGLGGQLDYFGLWIDQSFQFGHSKANPLCSTYNSPQLSCQQEFEIDEVEVWRLRKEEEEEEQNKLSILDSNPEAAAILEMADHKMYSKDVRDPTLDL